MHARRLPLAYRCTGFVGRPAEARAPAWCDRCSQPVHDLSRRTAAEVDALIHAHAGRRLCVAYRVRRDGEVVLRRGGAGVVAAAVAAAALACAPYRVDEPAAADACVDAAGYEVPCPPRAGVLVIPHAPPRPAARPRSREPQRRGEVVVLDDDELMLLGVFDEDLAREAARRP